MKAGIITLFLMSEKGYRFLQCTVKNHRDLYSMVVVGTDKSVESDYAEEILQLCSEHSLPVVRRPEFKEITTEYALAVSWRWLISHPTEKLIIFHDSLLPKYRGFAPLPTALIKGEKRVGVTALLGAVDFDRGPILAQNSMEVRYPLKIAEAIRLINNCYAEAGETVLSSLAQGSLPPTRTQDESAASYSVWRDEDDYAIDWTKSAEEIGRFIDALGPPYRGASTWVDNQLIRIFDAIALDDVEVEIRQPGKVLFVQEGLPVVICGQGLLKIIHCKCGDENFLPLKKFRVRFTQKNPASARS